MRPAIQTKTAPVRAAFGLMSNDAQQFFDLSREELAEFSCVCGGSINNNKLAERIERIAAGAK
jgi:hypothetical protein